MSTAMERYEQPLALVQNIDDLARLSKQVADSNYYGDMKSAAQAGVKLMIARELGLGVTAISNIHLVDGKIQLGYQILIALVKRSGKYDMRFLERTDELVKIEWFEDGKSVGFSKFDMKDAERAGLTKPSRSGNPSNFLKYPIRMLTARAVSDGFSTYAPECAGGALYTEGEIGDAPTPPARPIAAPRTAPTPAPRPDMDEEVVEAEVVEAPVVAAAAEGPQVPTLDLDQIAPMLKAMSAPQRKAVRESCTHLGIQWDGKLPQTLYERFGDAALAAETLIPALAAALDVPAVGTAEGEVDLAEVERQMAEARQFAEERDNGTLDAEVEAERKARRMAAAGTFGES